MPPPQAQPPKPRRRASVQNASGAYRISDQDLATRLSFFLWDAGPEVELIKAANAGALRTPAGLEKQVRRMLADKRSESLSTRFASRWNWCRSSVLSAPTLQHCGSGRDCVLRWP